MDTALYYFLEAWSLWRLPFAPLPYGDPYVAAITLFLVCFILIWRMDSWWSPRGRL